MSIAVHQATVPRHPHPGHQGHEAELAGQTGKLGLQILPDMPYAGALEIPVAARVKVDKNRHDRAGGPTPDSRVDVELVSLPFLLDLWAEIIDRADKRE